MPLFRLMRTVKQTRVKTHAPLRLVHFLSKPQKHRGLNMISTHVQILAFDRRPAGSAVCPPCIKPLLLAAGARLCISVVLGGGEGRVSEHLESACAGDGSGGQLWLDGKEVFREQLEMGRRDKTWGTL